MHVRAVNASAKRACSQRSLCVDWRSRFPRRAEPDLLARLLAEWQRCKGTKLRGAVLDAQGQSLSPQPAVKSGQTTKAPSTPRNGVCRSLSDVRASRRRSPGRSARTFLPPRYKLFTETVYGTICRAEPRFIPSEHAILSPKQASTVSAVTIISRNQPNAVRLRVSVRAHIRGIFTFATDSGSAL